MKDCILLLLAAALILPAHDLLAQSYEQSVLFDDQEPVEFTLTGPLKTVYADRSDEPEYQPARLELGGEDAKTLDIRLRTRGNFRLKQLDCDVPPLRIDLEESDTEGTVFEGQGRLKLVTHCKDRADDYEQRVIKEYLIYRAYALLTDVGFRARLAKVTYVDEEERHDTITKTAFLIEDDDELVARLGAEKLDDRRIHPEATDRAATTRLAVFQYMIGNTDWGQMAQHNIETIYVMPSGPIYVIPYDFDWSGLVGSPYAEPNPKLNIDSIEERKYMGFCREEEEIEAALEEFQANRDAILALFSEEYLSERESRRATRYLEDFFKQIGNPSRFFRRIDSDCVR